MIITALILLGIGALLGYGYFHYRKKPTDHFADQDYIDCESSNVGASKDQVAMCYIDKKSKKMRKELNLVD